MTLLSYKRTYSSRGMRGLISKKHLSISDLGMDDGSGSGVAEVHVRTGIVSLLTVRNTKE